MYEILNGLRPDYLAMQYRLIIILLSDYGAVSTCDGSVLGWIDLGPGQFWDGMTGYHGTVLYWYLLLWRSVWSHPKLNNVSPTDTRKQNLIWHIGLHGLVQCVREGFTVYSGRYHI